VGESTDHFKKVEDELEAFEAVLVAELD